MAADDPPNTSDTLSADDLTVRSAGVEDAAEIWRIVHDSKVLDENSPYCYLLLCRDFAETCVVACQGDAIIGFVTAYCPPPRPDCIFVWQVAVTEAARGRGVARRLLDALVALPACRDVRFLEATVTPSNTASRRLFASFAERRGVPCEIGEGFTAEMFASAGHEAEELFRIGPLS